MSCYAHALADSRQFLRREDVDLIVEMCEKLDPRTIVDLGAGSGTTALAAFAGVSGQRVALTTVDAEESQLDWARAAVANAGRADQWQALLSDSADASVGFDDNSVDLLLIDTSHTYEQTSKELAAWLPKVRSGGGIWLHDYLGEYPGVGEALEEVVGQLTLYKVQGLGWGGWKT